MEPPELEKRHHDLLEHVQALSRLAYPRGQVTSQAWWRAVLTEAGEEMPEDAALYYDEDLTWQQLFNVWSSSLERELTKLDRWQRWWDANKPATTPPEPVAN